MDSGPLGSAHQQTQTGYIRALMWRANAPADGRAAAGGGHLQCVRVRPRVMPGGGGSTPRGVPLRDALDHAASFRRCATGQDDGRHALHAAQDGRQQWSRGGHRKACSRARHACPRVCDVSRGAESPPSTCAAAAAAADVPPGRTEMYWQAAAASMGGSYLDRSPR